jgi:small subunit ribosomal protein S1
MEQILEKPNTVKKQSSNGTNGAKVHIVAPDIEQEALSFADLLDKYQYPEPQEGEILQGTILRVSRSELLVDIGSKRDGVVPHNELSELDPTLLDNLSRGDIIPVYIQHTPRGDQDLVVSYKRGLEQEDWVRARRLMDAEEIIELPVISYNKGGLQVQFGHISGFVPNSRELELRRIRDRRDQLDQKRDMVGDLLPLQIIEIDEQRQRLVLSAIEAQQEGQQDRLEALNEGDVVRGIISSLTDFGAFVDVGHGLTGLLHVSKISWQQVNHPADVLEVGSEIEVRIDNVDVEKKRISLNRRALIPGPWDEFVLENQVGDLIEGVVTSLSSFGAFVEVRPGLEGLLHKSEMELMEGQLPSSVVSPGDQLLLRIVSIDRERERLGLSMNRVTDAEEVDWMLDREPA